MVRKKALAQRIRLEIDDLEQIVDAIVHHWQRAHTVTEDQDAFLNSVAFNMHSFYTGIERIIELIAVEMDGGTLGGDAWHSELLRQMTLEVPDTRPAVFSKNTGQSLEEYLKFHHRMRNIYTTHLDAGRMEYVVEELSPTWQQTKTELLAFADFLDQLGMS